MRNLFDFFAKYNNWLLFVLLEVVSFVMLFRFNSYQGSVWLTSANYVTGKIFEIDSAIEAFFSLTKVNQELTLKNFYLERQVNQLSRLYGEATGDTLVKEHLSRTNVEQYKLVKGSQHLKGEAADIHVENTEHLLKIMHFIMDETDFDQLIWEKNKQGTQWVHVSYRRNGVNKHQVLSSRELLFTTKIK